MNERLQYLLGRFSSNKLNESEFEELMLFVEKEEHEAQVKAWMLKDLEATDPSGYDKEYWQQFFRDKITTRQTKLVPLYRKPIFKWIAAASVIIIASLILVISKRSEKSPSQVAQTHDVSAPTNTRAVITLADGSKVYLDSANNGTIAQQNNVNVIKNANGEIVYSPHHSISQSSITYNTLFNPRGSKVISLTLSDGTKVWLNSESSLKYPAAFVGNIREVEITGEAYFEVKHNNKQPFKVHLPNGSIIEDIGTAFNVNAYADESDIKTTLIEGSVRIANSDQRTAILKPGQQAIENTNSPNHFITTSPDIEEVLAWKNGRFSYSAADIKTIMREVARWYDVDVVYESNINEKFYAEVPRNTNVSTLLKMLEITKAVHFKVEGKKITVTK